jgi:hypothetical protein
MGIGRRERVALPCRSILAACRSRQRAREPAPQGFDGLLAAWGLPPGNIPAFVRLLYLRLLIFVLTGALLGSALGLEGFRVAGSTVGLVSAFGALTTLWRIGLARKRAYLSFRAWLFSVFFQGFFKGIFKGIFKGPGSGSPPG